MLSAAVCSRLGCGIPATGLSKINGRPYCSAKCQPDGSFVDNNATQMIAGRDPGPEIKSGQTVMDVTATVSQKIKADKAVLTLVVTTEGNYAVMAAQSPAKAREQVMDAHARECKLVRDELAKYAQKRVDPYRIPKIEDERFHFEDVRDHQLQPPKIVGFKAATEIHFMFASQSRDEDLNVGPIITRFIGNYEEDDEGKEVLKGVVNNRRVEGIEFDLLHRNSEIDILEGKAINAAISRAGNSLEVSGFRKKEILKIRVETQEPHMARGRGMGYEAAMAAQPRAREPPVHSVAPEYLEFRSTAFLTLLVEPR